MAEADPWQFLEAGAVGRADKPTGRRQHQRKGSRRREEADSFGCPRLLSSAATSEKHVRAGHPRHYLFQRTARCHAGTPGGVGWEKSPMGRVGWNPRKWTLCLVPNAFLFSSSYCRRRREESHLFE